MLKRFYNQWTRPKSTRNGSVMTNAIFTILVLFFLAPHLNAQNSVQFQTKKPLSERPKVGNTIQLSPDTIFITVSDAEPHFIIQNIDKSLDAKKLITFLSAFYENKKTKRKNDIVVRSITKRIVPGESEFNKSLDEIRRKHRINLVHLPTPTGSDTNAAITEFARRHLK